MGGNFEAAFGGQGELAAPTLWPGGKNPNLAAARTQLHFLNGRGLHSRRLKTGRVAQKLPHSFGRLTTVVGMPLGNICTSAAYCVQGFGRLIRHIEPGRPNRPRIPGVAKTQVRFQTPAERVVHEFKLLTRRIHADQPPRIDRFAVHALGIEPVARRLRSSILGGVEGLDFSETGFRIDIEELAGQDHLDFGAGLIGDLESKIVIGLHRERVQAHDDRRGKGPYNLYRADQSRLRWSRKNWLRHRRACRESECRRRVPVREIVRELSKRRPATPSVKLIFCMTPLLPPTVSTAFPSPDHKPIDPSGDLPSFPRADTRTLLIKETGSLKLPTAASMRISFMAN